MTPNNTQKTLPRELFSLVHHVALNESGWWEKNIQKIILSAFWMSENYSVSLDSLRSVLRDSFGLTLSSGVIDEHVKTLTEDNSILQISPLAYKLSENGIEKIILEIKEHLEAEKLAADSFKALCKVVCPDLSAEAQWIRFNEELLHPLVQSSGARTFELIVTNNASLDGNAAVQHFLESYSEKNRDAVKNLIRSFFAPKQLAARRYILRKINTYFCLEACSLSADMIRTVVPNGSQTVTWKLFLDSNVLFSFLGLHDARSNETAQALRSLVHEVNSGVRVQFCITPITLQETTKVLLANIELLKNIQSKKSINAATVGLELNGFAQKYFSDNGRSYGIVSVDEYFSPYIHNLTTIIRSKGIEIYLANVDEYKTDKNVAEDITAYHSDTRPNRLSESEREKFEHDVALWHFVKDIRPNYFESPVDAVHWILTFDQNFLGFDASKRNAIGYGDIPVCINPASMVEVLHVWAPRSEKFVRAVTNSRRLPFLMRGFDSESETVTLKILQTLFRFEQIDALPHDVVSSILMNTLLRNKISGRSAAAVRSKPADSVRSNESVSAPVSTRANRSEENDFATLNERLRAIEQQFRDLKSSISTEPEFSSGNISRLYK